jgi:predicted phosphodiesterase
MMRTIGAISDTHGLLRPQALAALAGCDPIIHAGDIASPDVLRGSARWRRSTPCAETSITAPGARNYL